MATIAKLVVQAFLDPTGVKRGADEAIREVRRIQNTTKKIFNTTQKVPELVNASQAQKALSALTEAFNTETAKSRDAFFRGIIDKSAFKAAGVASAKNFNAGLAAAIDDLSSKKVLTPTLFKALTQQYKLAGTDSGRQFNLGAQRTAAANPLLGDLSTPGQKAANSLLNGFNKQYKTTINSLRDDLVNGLISVQQYRRRAQVAASEFDKGLSAGLAELKNKGQATDAITEALVGSYKLAGLRAANAFQLSLDKQLGQNLSSIGRTLSAAITVPVIAAGGATLKLAGDFELSMNRIRAILQPTKVELQALQDQARQIGAISQFSARDAAEAQAKLAQQGFSVQQVLATMPSVLELAASALIDLTSAADVGSTILNTYGQSNDQFVKSVDTLVKVSLSAKTSVQDLSDAFRYVGPKARQAGLEFNDVAAAIAVLSKAGLVGTLGGTALRNILIRLINPTKKSSAALKAMGVEAFDSTGKMRPLVDIIRQFEVARARTKDVESFNRALGNIFETRAGTGFTVLLQAGSDKLAEITDKLNNAGGTAARVSKVQMSGLVGSFREFVSVVEELGLAIADSGLLQSFNTFLRAVTDAIRAFAQLSPGVKSTLVNMSLLAAAVGPLLIAIGKVSVTFALLRALLVLINGPTALAGMALSLATGGAVLVGLAALAAVLIKVASNSAKAAAGLAEFKNSLSNQGLAQLEKTKAYLLEQIEIERNMNKLARDGFAGGKKPSAFSEVFNFRQSRTNIQNLEDKLKLVQEAIEKVGTSTAGTANTVDDTLGSSLQGIIDSVGALGDLDLSGLFEGQATPLEQLQTKAKLLLGLLDAVGDKYQTLPGLVSQLASVYDTVLAKVGAQKGAVNDTTLALLNLKNELESAFKKTKVVAVNVDPTELQNALDKLSAQADLKVRVTPSLVADSKLKDIVDTEFDRFKKIAERAASTKLDLDIATRLGDANAIATAGVAYQRAVATATSAEQRLLGAVEVSNLGYERKKELIEQINKLLKEYGVETKSTRAETLAASRDLEGLANAVQGILNVADSMGKIGDNAKEALRSVVELIRAVDDFQRSKALASVFGQIGAGIGIAGSLISLFASLNKPSAAQEELNAIQRKNNEELASLRLELRNFRASQLGDVLNVKDALPNVLSVIEGIFKSKDIVSAAFLSLPEVFDDYVKKFGTSLEEISAIADSMNINIFDKNGVILLSQLAKLSEAIALSVEGMIRFGKSLDDQAAKLDLKRNVFNLDTSGVGAIQDQIELLTKFAPKLAEMFSGFDASTAEGRRQIEQALQALFTMLEENILVPSDFGLLNGADDLTKIIKAIADSLDSFRSSVDGVTGALSNVPEGLKIDLLRFNSAFADVTSSTVKNTPSTGGNVPVPTNVTSNTSFNFSGDIVIDGVGKDARELTDEILRELRARAKATTGRTSDWYKVNT